MTGTSQTMKIIIVYMSISHGNTEKVAQAMAVALNADVTKADQITPEMLRTYDVVGFGSGIYFGRHHKQLQVDWISPRGKNSAPRG